MDEALELLLNAYTLLITHQTSFVIAIEAMQWDKRDIQEPDAESVVRGPREGFVENLQTNMSLLRLRIRTPSLKMETLKKGQMTKIAITFAYIEGVTTEQLIEEVRRTGQDYMAAIKHAVVFDGRSDFGAGAACLFRAVREARYVDLPVHRLVNRLLHLGGSAEAAFILSGSDAGAAGGASARAAAWRSGQRHRPRFSSGTAPA
ncbi:spore germination protein [Paenibacillus melissococcoides]|uniref:Spore germination protein n=1 Tax=Paenibacillus melissococcoides TaxID=2912268 RepID=A0ABN8U1B3_9BACL|nr:hypothetical protein J6TS7_49710 [Paenibacillus dendritiformis]CAH8244864.1 spore germination protein [Paenibacillus melissococcoides]CAH8709204.1 spore germination protein [Paenibacillus melissococcoides]CAH8709960.1 spore germination protein [Paenibacillus melissococcoides]